MIRFPVVAEMIRCKALAARERWTERRLESGTTVRLSLVKTEGGWRELWLLMGEDPTTDMEGFLAQANWQGNQPELEFREDGAVILRHFHAQNPPQEIRRIAAPPPPPVVEAIPVAVGPEFNPDDLGPTFDEDDYASYRDDD